MPYSRCLDAAQHAAAQDLRTRYAPQLLALEANLDPSLRCYDAGLIAARLVKASLAPSAPARATPTPCPLTGSNNFT